MSKEPGALHNMGRVLAWRGDDIAAVRYLKDACTRDPNNPIYWNTLGVALSQTHEFDEARGAFIRAIEIDPERFDPHVNLAHDHLCNGEFEKGWAEHEWRLRRPEFKQRMRTAPWQGEDISGKTILLWPEQGLGDAIHFVRYAPLVAARGARVVLEARAALQGIFRSVEGVTDVVLPGQSPPHDNHAALMSLPSIFGVLEGTKPYLAPPPAINLENSDRRRIGLVWAGNPAHSNDRNRSHSLERFALLANDNLAFYALQVGEAARQPAPAGMSLQYLGESFRDFSDTAAALAAIDLLIGVDTSVAHLAGALGIPTWLILPSNPDWRWGREGDRTPWYPTMRLFRQTPNEQPQAVFDRIAMALAADQ